MTGRDDGTGVFMHRVSCTIMRSSAERRQGGRRGRITRIRPSFQLLVGEPHFLEKQLPAWVVVEPRERPIGTGPCDAGIALAQRALEPLESAVVLAPVRIDLRNLIGRSVRST